MASRNIANMHLFLEMKKKFPDLPEDTLRNYVLLYAEDQSKCVSMLQKERKISFHSSKKFPEHRLSENKPRNKKYQTMKIDSGRFKDSSTSNALFIQNNIGPETMLNDSDKSRLLLQKQINTSDISTRSTINLPLKPSNLNTPVMCEAKSAPVLSDQNNKPFRNMYQEPTSSQISEPTNRMMFSTTKEHTVGIPKENKDSYENPRHAVQLSITPSFPFPQQQMSVYTSAVSTANPQTSKAGRHSTSLNFRLQPHSADSYPVEISTVPTNVANPCDFNNFGSHLQISVGAQGATFTALRLQRPQPSTRVNVTPSSSQSQDSKVYKFSTTELRQVSEPSGANANQENFGNPVSRLAAEDGYQSGCTQISSLQPRIEDPSENFASQFNGFQESPDYVEAVKKHQLARLDLVREELKKERTACSNLKSEVNRFEQEIVRRQQNKSSFSYVELLKKIKEENRKLRIECNCLLMEYDIISKGQIPVGMTDEDFYSNIFTGPNDGLELNSSESSKETVSSRIRNLSVEEEDESNRWKCNKCTFANHPALEKCEMCELPKNTGSFFEEG
ncbi:hypothetical protein JTE90_028097 [Oedothorax gibbosus]|uniref:RanBP2-type domain-containing protein n=1 Tax=Oedothorax gibbosus TaxID=931172 RepID=A0AAV6VBB6_9ARAC|nr:hypothetical protein JTE90_028097 [Oedothorax gibbosus]